MGQGMENVVSHNTQSSSNANFVFHVTNGAHFLMVLLHWGIIACAIALILVGMFQINSGTNNNSDDNTQTGYRLIRGGVYLFLMYTFITTAMVLLAKYGWKRTLISGIIFFGIIAIMTTFPKQIFSGAAKGTFYELFQEGEVEKYAMKSFNNLHVQPIVIIILIIIASAIVLFI